MTVDFKEYQKDLKNFIDRHSKKALLKIETSPMVNKTYYKHYMFSDGSNFEEINSIIEEEVVVCVHGVEIPVVVSLRKLEYFSTDFGASKFVYEQA